jgi:plasmid maintenance system antidote protein VapI
MENTTKQRYRATGLTETLEQQGRTAAWLGRQLGVHRSYVTHIAAGRRTVDGDRAARVAQLLGVPERMLFELASESETLSLAEVA